MKSVKADHIYIFYLTVLALFVQALIPAGFMPQQGKDGTITMVICTASGTSEVLWDGKNFSPTKEDNQDKKNGKDHTYSVNQCPFAAVHTYDASVRDIVIAYLETHVSDEKLLLSSLVSKSLKEKPWLSQGPPRA